MSYLIATTGKGGVGKTTITSLLIQRMIFHKRIPILAVDADPNTNLDIALGIKVEKTVGSVREEVGEEAKKGLAAGISKQQLLEMKIAEGLVESENFDYLAMGRPEGPGCYCYANNILKSVLFSISSNYPYVVLDNEAGLENLSRRIVQKVDTLLIISDHSKVGFATIKRLYELALEMKIDFKKVVVVINKLRANTNTTAEFDINGIKADAIIGIPYDEEIAKMAEAGKKIDATELAQISKTETIKKIDRILEIIFNGR
ncbi:MAG: AAA family ATPase [Oligoflexia bacterium]|nr:AAA family ATPase [Oligoflexia bacterium]